MNNGERTRARPLADNPLAGMEKSDLHALLDLVLIAKQSIADGNPGHAAITLTTIHARTMDSHLTATGVRTNTQLRHPLKTVADPTTTTVTSAANALPTATTTHTLVTVVAMQKDHVRNQAPITTTTVTSAANALPTATTTHALVTVVAMQKDHVRNQAPIMSSTMINARRTVIATVVTSNAVLTGISVRPVRLSGANDHRATFSNRIRNTPAGGVVPWRKMTTIRVGDTISAVMSASRATTNISKPPRSLGSPARIGMKPIREVKNAT